MARDTLLSRATTQLQGVLEARGLDLPFRTEKAKGGYYFIFGSDPVELVEAACIYQALVRIQGCRCGWSRQYRGWDGYIRIFIGRETSVWGTSVVTKASECLRMTPDYEAIKGFKANTNSDLQLFNCQGFGREDARACREAAGLPATRFSRS